MLWVGCTCWWKKAKNKWRNSKKKNVDQTRYVAPSIGIRKMSPKSVKWRNSQVSYINEQHNTALPPPPPQKRKIHGKIHGTSRRRTSDMPSRSNEQSKSRQKSSLLLVSSSQKYLYSTLISKLNITAEISFAQCEGDVRFYSYYIFK